MTNLITFLTFVTNIVSPVGDGPHGVRWLQTNITSSIIVYPVPGLGVVTSTVPVFTNVVTVYGPTWQGQTQSVMFPHRVLTQAEADAKGLPPLTKQ